MVEVQHQSGSAKSSRRGQNDNNNCWLGINKQFCIPYGAESTASICRGHDSDCIEVNAHQVAIFRVKHLNLDIERTWRDVISLALLFILLVLIILYRFPLKQIA